MLIQFKEKDAVNGFWILVNNGQVGRYANNTYAIGKEHLELLKKARIKYFEIDS